MSILSDQNIEFITKRINESKIESAEMKEDLIDHFCCAVYVFSIIFYITI